MASWDTLQPEQRALLDILARHGWSYERLAEALEAPAARIRSRSHEALRALGEGRPALDAASEERLADYLLGQQSAAEWASTRQEVASSPEAQAWVRQVVDSFDGGERLPPRIAESAAVAAEEPSPGPVARPGPPPEDPQAAPPPSPAPEPPRTPPAAAERPPVATASPLLVSPSGRRRRSRRAAVVVALAVAAALAAAVTVAREAADPPPDRAGPSPRAGSSGDPGQRTDEPRAPAGQPEQPARGGAAGAPGNGDRGPEQPAPGEAPGDGDREPEEPAAGDAGDAPGDGDRERHSAAGGDARPPDPAGGRRPELPRTP